MTSDSDGQSAGNGSRWGKSGYDRVIVRYLPLRHSTFSIGLQETACPICPPTANSESFGFSMRFKAILIAIFLHWILEPVSHAVAQLPSPELNALGQLGGQIDQPIVPLDKAAGQNLTESVPSFSCSAIKDGKIAGDLQPGVVQVRAQNSLGLSNSRNFLVTSQPWAIITGNESQSTAAGISLDGVFQDECPERGRNYYRLKLDRDQNIEIESFAHSLDSRAKLNLSILTTSTTKIAFANATNDRDAVLRCKLLANIDYTLVAHDHLYRGGPDYRYAICVKSVSDEFLLNRSAGKAATACWQELCSQIAAIQTSSQPHKPINPQYLLPRCSLVRPPTVDKTPNVHVESSAPNAAAVTVEWPTLIDGVFDANDDVDMFDFDCEKDANVVIEVVSQRIGQLTDSAIVIYRVDNPKMPNEKMNRLAENDDLPATGNGEMRFAIKDSLLTFKAPEKGTYRLAVRNQQNSDRLATPPRYAVEIRQPKPGFALACHWASPVRDLDQARMTSNTINLGGSALLSVHALRFDGFNSPIELTVSGLPEDIRGGAGVIAIDQNIATLSLWHDAQGSVPATSEPILSLHVAGQSKVGEQMLASVATPVEVIWGLIDTFRSPIARITSDLLCVRSASRTCPITIELGPTATSPGEPIVMSCIRGQPLKVPIRVTRREGGVEAVVLVRLRQTPTKTTAAEVKLEAKSTEGTLELQIPKDAPIGEYLLSTLCEAPISIPNLDPAAKDKTTKITLQLPSSCIRLRIGDAP